MALHQLASLPISCTKMLPLERKSAFLATKCFNVPCPILECRASSNVSNRSQTIPRRHANFFQPSIWHHDYIQSLRSEFTEELYTEKSRVLREEVRMMFSRVVNHIDQLELIDVLQRLGVAYHFHHDISSILENIYNMNTVKRKKILYATALEFRILRQHGYNLSTDVFDSFLDEMGNFKKSQSVDVEGMLSLYEASFHLLENENILEEARDFTSKFLKEYVNNNRGDYISVLINHALKLPLHWRVPRWETEWFINAYERRKNMSPALLEFAKLDFNMVQTIYQDELKYASRWWKRTGLADKLSFGRDRLVENFIWAVGTNFKPDFGYFRRVVTKINSLITIIDDIYDVYGTIEELELFTEAIDRWDLNAMDSLPDYMKICFLALYNFVNETGFEFLKEKGYHIIPYLKKAWADLCKTYLIEAKWYHSGYTPSMREYEENAWISIGAPVALIHAYFLIPNTFKVEELAYLEECPNIIRFSAMILRLANDLGTSKRESETGDVPKSVQCYMNETGASEADACEHVKSMMYTTWKKMNEEARCSSFSRNFIDTAINLGRMAICMYQHGDGQSIQCPEMKSLVQSLIILPIPGIYPSKEFGPTSGFGCFSHAASHITLFQILSAAIYYQLKQTSNE